MVFPNIDPVAIHLGPLAIRWYALAYVVGILLGQWYVTWLDRTSARLLPSGEKDGMRGLSTGDETNNEKRMRVPSSNPLPQGERALSTPLLTDKARDDLVLYAVLGIILGGRIGYILFYNAAYYFQNPADILQVWHGGMSFHGGLLGVLIAFYFFARRYKIHWLALMDLLAAATPIGLFLGRCANFVNDELYGRVTSAPWGIVFPNGGPMPRHPSQLYEAGLEGLVLFAVLFLVATRTRALHYRGIIGGLFIGGYGIARFIIEFFREPDVQVGTFTFGLSMGQLLCMPMIAVGLWLVLTARGRPNAETAFSAL